MDLQTAAESLATWFLNFDAGDDWIIKEPSVQETAQEVLNLVHGRSVPQCPDCHAQHTLPLATKILAYTAKCFKWHSTYPKTLVDTIFSLTRDVEIGDPQPETIRRLQAVIRSASAPNN